MDHGICEMTAKTDLEKRSFGELFDNEITIVSVVENRFGCSIEMLIIDHNDAHVGLEKYACV
jgi:hypothetical protein